MEIPPIDSGTESLLRLRRSPEWFAEHAVFTLDQADKFNPIKRFPLESEKPHPYVVMRYMGSDPLIALVKHRRMLMTWTCCGVVPLHEAMFYEGRFIALISKKEEDSDELVRRCKFIYDNIPPDVMRVKPKLEYKYTQIHFPEINSTIKGFAQGADQLRQYTCSRIVADEIAFWPSARASFVAMKPTIEGGGKVTLLSTRFPGFFQEIVEDRLDYAA